MGGAVDCVLPCHHCDPRVVSAQPRSHVAYVSVGFRWLTIFKKKENSETRLGLEPSQEFKISVPGVNIDGAYKN